MVYSVPNTALERLIIGTYFGNFDTARLAYDLSKSFPGLRTIAAEDVGSILAHQKRFNTRAWVACTQGLKRQDPKVLRILREVRNQPDGMKKPS